jgi:hypothetical protein
VGAEVGTPAFVGTRVGTPAFVGTAVGAGSGVGVGSSKNPPQVQANATNVSKDSIGIAVRKSFLFIISSEKIFGFPSAI